ncbi:putative cysteine sulfinic acid decarboxylase [Nadsonia fulvescens var. elongata DSM 6958]|uniref:Putative cysteine sulfinic acid decarboxylase n=1 Tax=Nadsonia fulvescens var. elongata DSM 6958 TaxID=857566 RepID=A0A1E3PMF8_9ASCO|nr:putative cysteine sulfinic acid decarboxylase [Nadsonia fulvescens var. elongata DSM 6958]
MSKTKIESPLEANRVKELERILDQVSAKVIQYVAQADQKSGSIGNHIAPLELREKIKSDLELPLEGEGEQGLMEAFDMVLDNSVVTWHPGFLDKLYASTNPVGVASDILLSVLNTNSHVFTVSPALTLIEKKTSHEYAKLFGFSGPNSGGLTMPGGSGSNTTSLTIARSVLYPDTKLEGNGSYKFAVFCSEHAHYSVDKSAILLGMGSRSVFKVKVNARGEMITEELERAISKAKEDGYTPLYINATAGTTVFGSFDPFDEIADVAQRHNLWMHIDGSWGGNIVFSEKQKYKLKGSERANSLTVNPHKLLGVPTTCSFLLTPDISVFQQANSLQAPYLFHNNHDNQENFDLADATMQCGRRADALKLFLGWKWFGKQGYEQRINHAFEVVNYFCEQLKTRYNFLLVSDFPPPCMQVCFYYAPGGKLANTASENSEVTRRIAQELHKSGKFLVDYAPESGPNGRGEFFRVVINSPVVSSETVDSLIAEIEKIAANF